MESVKVGNGARSSSLDNNIDRRVVCKSDGTQQWMTPQDAAKALMPLMDIASGINKGLMPVGGIGPLLPTIGVIKDFNTFEANDIGLCLYLATMTTPNNPSGDWGIILRLQRATNEIVTSSQAIFDLFFDSAGSILYRSSKGDGSGIIPGSWRKLSMSIL